MGPGLISKNQILALQSKGSYPTHTEAGTPDRVPIRYVQCLNGARKTHSYQKP